MNEKILVIDDDREIRNIISIYLKNEGYEVIEAEDGQQALNLVKENIDLIILDIMMPKMDGICVCNEIRKKYMMPIIFLSAKDEEIHKILGLSSGAEDYITKPFSAIELIARIKSQIRRYKRYNMQNEDETIIEIGNLKIDSNTRQVFRGDQEIFLTAKEFSILELLAKNKGIVMSIRKIYEKVWGEPFFKSDNTVMVHITNIRQKIEQDPKNPIYIKTIWGVGYKI